MAEHSSEHAPSRWVSHWAGQIVSGARVLDLACGSGRHTRLLANMGFRVLAVDRDCTALGSLAELPNVEVHCADLEGAPWPFAGQRFGAIVVTNYLHRPLLPTLVDGLQRDGILIYETFAVGNERYGRPANPAFLLRPGELLDVVRGRLRVIAYEDRYVEEPKPAMMQRICAKREV